jgi:hypothetical protein
MSQQLGVNEEAAGNIFKSCFRRKRADKARVAYMDLMDLLHARWRTTPAEQLGVKERKAQATF